MTKYDSIIFQILESLKSEKKLKDNKEKEGIDTKKADLDKDGKLSEYEKKRGEAIQKAIAEKGKK
jgi:hypothetical protein